MWLASCKHGGHRRTVSCQIIPSLGGGIPFCIALIFDNLSKEHGPHVLEPQWKDIYVWLETSPGWACSLVEPAHVREEVGEREIFFSPYSSYGKARRALCGKAGASVIGLEDALAIHEKKASANHTGFHLCFAAAALMPTQGHYSWVKPTRVLVLEVSGLHLYSCCNKMLIVDPTKLPWKTTTTTKNQIIQDSGNHCRCGNYLKQN